jgi:hypothetical protein
MFEHLSSAARWVQDVLEGFQSARPNGREARGLKLLKDWLSPEQLSQYETTGFFDVIGCDSGNRYRIHYGAAMNIVEIDDVGGVRAGWCFVPRACLVAGDVMLAQKIALETDEHAALAVAKNFNAAQPTPRGVP